MAGQVTTGPPAQKNSDFVPTCPPSLQVHHLFELLKLQHIFVTHYGKLVGAVTRTEVPAGTLGEQGMGSMRGQHPSQLLLPLAAAESHRGAGQGSVTAHPAAVLIKWLLGSYG